jgi:uncharacterized protein YecE (DUF72 family)
VKSKLASPPATQARGRISVGIGSWADREYNGLLYPKGLPDDERLKTYAQWFSHVEVNATFYRMPWEKAVAAWADQTPPDFKFDVKLHKSFAEDPAGVTRDESGVARFLGGLQPLIETKKLGALLLLMTPRFSPKSHRLEEFDPLIEKFRPHPLALELRNSGWVDEQHREATLEFFRSRRLVWVDVDMPRLAAASIMPALDEVTNPQLAYLRLHGRRADWTTLKTTEERHTYEYSAGELEEIATRVRALAAKADAVHVVANNHAKDLAPKTALALKKLLEASR